MRSSSRQVRRKEHPEIDKDGWQEVSTRMSSTRQKCVPIDYTFAMQNHDSANMTSRFDPLMKAFSVVASSLLLSLTLGVFPPAYAQHIDTKLLGEMQWRNVGPFRGGRTRAVSGVPSQANVFYVGAVNGGVWKTNDFGRTW